MARKKMTVGGARSVGPIVAQLLARDRAVLAAYLFGSNASGRARNGSDVDVAVLLSPRRAGEAFEFRLRYAADLEDLLGRRVDVVVLNQADPFLRFQVYSKGKLLFVRNRRKALEFQLYSMNEYWDYLPIKQAIEGTAVRRMMRGR